MPRRRPATNAADGAPRRLSIAAGYRGGCPDRSIRREAPVTAVVEIDRLTKRYGSQHAIRDISFMVQEGTITGFLGPNGSGKTTTLRILLGLVTPSSGAALVFGQHYRALDHPARRVGAVLEAVAHPDRAARDHLRALALPLRVGRRRIDQVLAAVDLADAADRPAGSFSLGMRGRLALAGALLGDPQLLVLDEPANGLDPAGIRWLRDFLRSWAAAGRSALLSSHVLAEVTQTVDHIVIVHEGRVVLDAPADEAGRGCVEVRSREVDRLAALLAADFPEMSRFGPDGLRLPATAQSDRDDGTKPPVTEGSQPAWVAEHIGLVAARHGIALLELHSRGPDLESTFFTLTRPDGSTLPRPEDRLDTTSVPGPEPRSPTLVGPR